MTSQLHKALTAEYFSTTVQRTSELNERHYIDSVTQMKRHLGSWSKGFGQDSPTCIDLACGCGEFLYFLESIGVRDTVGVDLCLPELECAKKFLKSSRLVHADISSHLQSVSSNSVDLITAFNILEHLDDDCLFVTMKEAARVLKPGGVLIACVPNASSPYGGMTRYWDLTHLRAFTPSSMWQLANVTGFKQLEFREMRPRFATPFSTIRSILWSFIRLVTWAHHMILFASPKGGIYSADMLIKFSKSR